MAGKVLVAFEHLPERKNRAQRVAALDTDIRDAADRLRKKVLDRAAHYSNTGWVPDDESWELAISGRTLVGRMTIRRP